MVNEQSKRRSKVPRADLSRLLVRFLHLSGECANDKLWPLQEPPLVSVGPLPGHLRDVARESDSSLVGTTASQPHVTKLRHWAAVRSCIPLTSRMPLKLIEQPTRSKRRSAASTSGSITR